MFKNILGYHGLIDECRANKECISFGFWLLTKENKLQRIDTLLKHNKKNLKYSDIVTENYVDSAIQYLEDNLDNFRDGFDKKNRGFFSIEDLKPIDEYVIWNDHIEDMQMIVDNIPFYHLLTKLNYSCNIPDYYKKIIKEKYSTDVSEWLKSEEIQLYLKNKAVEMVKFWESKIGGIGNLDGQSDIGALLLVLTNSKVPHNLNDVETFLTRLYVDIMANFNIGRVPFYDVDYGPGWELCGISEGLNIRFPYKTWKHFDFGDAPKFKLK